MNLVTITFTKTDQTYFHHATELAEPQIYQSTPVKLTILNTELNFASMVMWTMLDIQEFALFKSLGIFIKGKKFYFYYIV